MKIQKGRAGGSGVIVGHKDGKAAVLTALHVVNNPGAITVSFADGRTASGKEIKSDKHGYDLALIEVETSSVPAVAEISDAFPEKNEPITLCGFGGGRWKELRGKVHGYEPRSGGSNATGYELAVSATSIPGDSGGPIFDGRGKLAGILWGGPVNPFSGNMLWTRAAAAPTIKEFVRRTGWLLGPNITIQQPAQTPLIQQPATDPVASAAAARAEGAVSSLEGRVGSLERDIADLNGRAREWDAVSQRVSDYENYAKGKLPVVEAAIEKLKADQNQTLNELGRMASVAVEDAKGYDAKWMEIKQQWATDDAKRADAIKGALDVAMTATNAASTARLEAVEAKGELNRLQSLYLKLPDEAKQAAADKFREATDKFLPNEAQDKILTAAHEYASGVHGKDITAYGIGALLLSILGGVGIKALYAKNPALGAVAEKVVVPLAKRFIRRRIGKTDDGQDIIEEVPVDHPQA